MSGPRSINYGTKVGWGLVAFVVGVYGVMVTAIGAAIAWIWKRYRQT